MKIRNKRIIISVIALIVSPIIIIGMLVVINNMFLTPDLNKIRCNYLEKMSRISFSGIIDSKQVDTKNPNNNKIFFHTLNKKDSLYLVIDRSGLIEYIEIGDSIYKEVNSLDVLVRRGNNNVTYRIDYDCIEE